MSQGARRLGRLGLALLLVAGGTTCSPPKPRWNVLLITIDTLRADRISALGGRATTPGIDKTFVENGVLCTHAQTPRAKTTPAIASLMTGLYPHEHGVRDLMVPLELSFPTLAERLRAAGWRTGAIVGNYVLKDRFSGLARGFEQWTEELPQTQGVPPDDVPQRTAKSLTLGALAALGSDYSPALPADAGPRQALARSGEPWFLWLHYMDPHGAYDPEKRPFTHEIPEPIPIAAPGSERAKRQRIAEYNVPPEARLADGSIDAATVRDLYDGEVKAVDDALVALFALGLRGLGNTLVIITADHGENLGEHDDWFEHGRDTYEATCRVPLIVVFPGGDSERTKGTRCSADISLADLAPTILEYLGLPPLTKDSSPSAVRGHSRLAALLGHGSDPAPVFSEKVERIERSQALQLKAVRIGDWKLIRRYAQVFEGAPADGRLVDLGEELYDLAADPREEHDLARAAPANAPLARLRAELERFVSSDARFGEQARELTRRRAALGGADPEAERILRGLGY